MSSEIQVLIFSMIPTIELNGSIPIGLIVLNLPLWKTFLISFLGNVTSVMIFLSLLEPISTFLSKKSKTFKKKFNRLFLKIKKKIRPKIGKYGKIGLAFFVSLPFPLTGGWTGAIAAYLIGMPFKSACLLITFGILVKGIIVSTLTLSGIAINRYFGWKILLIIVIISIIIYFVRKLRINNLHPL